MWGYSTWYILHRENSGLFQINSVLETRHPVKKKKKLRKHFIIHVTPKISWLYKYNHLKSRPNVRYHHIRSIYLTCQHDKFSFGHLANNLGGGGG